MPVVRQPRQSPKWEPRVSSQSPTSISGHGKAGTAGARGIWLPTRARSGDGNQLLQLLQRPYPRQGIPRDPSIKRCSRGSLHELRSRTLRWFCPHSPSFVVYTVQTGTSSWGGAEGPAWSWGGGERAGLGRTRSSQHRAGRKCRSGEVTPKEPMSRGFSLLFLCPFLA